MHLGDDRSIVGQLEAGDDTDPGFVEPGGDDRHRESGGDGMCERPRHRRRVVRTEDRLHDPRHPPGVRVRDQRRQLVHYDASSRRVR